MLPFQVDATAATATVNWAEWVANLVLAASAGFAAFQYRRNSQLKAAETLLKVEEEFRQVCGTFLEMEYDHLYNTEIAPVLEIGLVAATQELEGDTRKKLERIDRCLRFLYLCSVINQTLKADHVAWENKGVMPEAYYYYIGILLREEVAKRPALDRYTEQFYPRLRSWVDTNACDLRKIRTTKYRRAGP